MSELPKPVHHLHYPTTRWTSVIQAVRLEDVGRAQTALTVFCEQYRDVIYRFFLRKLGPDRADTYTQEFFLKKIQQPWLDQAGLLFKVEREPGAKFRYYLTQALTWFVFDMEKRSRDPLKDAVAEVPEVCTLDERERILQECDREIALGLIRRVTERLKLSNVYLRYFCEEISAEEGARELAISSGAFRVAVHRLVPAIREAFRDEVRAIVGSDEDVEAETRYLVKLIVNSRVT
jgi:DNA-directed RNA polymerase specialized sigma24 family protein